MIVGQNFPLFVKRTKNIPGGFCKFGHTFQSHINITTKQQSTVAARDLCQIGGRVIGCVVVELKEQYYVADHILVYSPNDLPQ